MQKYSDIELVSLFGDYNNTSLPPEVIERYVQLSGVWSTLKNIGKSGISFAKNKIADEIAYRAKKGYGNVKISLKQKPTSTSIPISNIQKIETSNINSTKSIDKIPHNNINTFLLLGSIAGLSLLLLKKRG